MFGDTAIRETQEKLREEQAELAREKRSRRRKYLREQIQSHTQHLQYLDSLFHRYRDPELPWTAEEEGEIDRAADKIRRGERTSDLFHRNELYADACRRRIKDNETTIRQWEHMPGTPPAANSPLSGYGEEVVARLTVENRARREALRRAGVAEEA